MIEFWIAEVPFAVFQAVTPCAAVAGVHRFLEEDRAELREKVRPGFGENSDLRQKNEPFIVYPCGKQLFWKLSILIFYPIVKNCQNV